MEANYRGIQEDHRLDIANINQTNADQSKIISIYYLYFISIINYICNSVGRMEEEIEILRSQLAGAQELHQEEIINIRMRYEREKSNYQRTISTLKKQVYNTIAQ